MSPECTLGEVAGSTGLEPATSGVTGQRSNQLNYDPARRATFPTVAIHLARPAEAPEERRLVGGTGIEPVTAGV
jgi:hypothetical protein